MEADESPEPQAPRGRRALVWLAITGVAGFVVIVAAEHLLVSQLDPRTHEISEYANARYGWLMTAGFLAWAVSLAATEVAMRERTTTAVRWALALAAASILLLTVFHTQTSAGRLPPGVARTVAGRLHDLGAGLTSLALVGAALATTLIREAPRAYRRQTLVLLATVAVADVALLIAGPGVAGVRQRLLVALGCIWQAGFIRAFDARGR